MELFLITGFLGAGKTTLIKELIGYFSDRKLYLIINEFGREGIDGALLSELGAAVDEICNGSIFCTCRIDQFEESLEKAVQDSPDVILVEASGLSDPTNIYKILSQERYSGINYRGGICLTDATRLHKVYDTARVVKKQISISDLILLNKTDKASPERIENARSLISEANNEAAVYPTTFGHIEPEMLKDLRLLRKEASEAENRVDLTQQKYLISVSREMNKRQIESFLSLIAEDTYRIKGILDLADGVYLVDCVGSFVKVTAYDSAMSAESNNLVVLSGKGMPTRQSIKKACEWYPQYIISVDY